MCMFCRLLFVPLYFFVFGHCVVCSSSIYRFWLPLCYLQTLLPTKKSHSGFHTLTSMIHKLFKVYWYEATLINQSALMRLCRYRIHWTLYMSWSFLIMLTPEWDFVINFSLIKSWLPKRWIKNIEQLVYHFPYLWD
jgi:hypothetical protein